MNKDLLTGADMTRKDLADIIDLSRKLKAERFLPSAPKPLAGKSI